MNYDNEAGGVIFSKTLNGHALAANQFNFTVTAPDGDTASAGEACRGHHDALQTVMVLPTVPPPCGAASLV